MEDLKKKTESLTDHVGDYLETYYKLASLNVTEKTAGLASVSVTMLCVSSLTLFALLFIGLGLSWWIGTAIDNMVGGFFIVAGIYVVLIFTILLLRKKYIAPMIQNFVIQKMYD